MKHTSEEEFYGKSFDEVSTNIKKLHSDMKHTTDSWENDRNVWDGPMTKYTDRIYREIGELHHDVWDEIKKGIYSALSEERKKLAREVDELNVLLPKNKTYDGNSLKSAGDHYGIAATSFSEIIRYENGYNAALYDVKALLTKDID